MQDKSQVGGEINDYDFVLSGLFMFVYDHSLWNANVMEGQCLVQTIRHYFTI